MTLTEMLAKVQDQDLEVSIHKYQSSYSYGTDWNIKLEKAGEGVALVATATGEFFEPTLREAFTKFFRAAEVGVDFATALPPPTPTRTRVEIDDEIPF